MKKNPSGAVLPVHRRRRPIRTSVMEVLKELTALTQDDALVLAAFKRIFNLHRVRLARNLAPVRLVASAAPRRRRSGFAGTKAWA